MCCRHWPLWALFVFWPLGQLVYLSLTDTSLLGGGKFIGFANYIKAFSDAVVLAGAVVHGQIHGVHHARS